MSDSKRKSLSIRIEDADREKLHSVARYYGRSANAHILYLIQQSIKAFEKEHGTIELFGNRIQE